MRDRRTHRQLNLEQRRQDLRDQRWRRWRSMILTMVLSAALLTDRIPVEQAIDRALAAIGMA